jgi:hypothetical protein
MKLNKKHAFVIIALGFLFSIPAVTAANTNGAVLAQDTGEDFFFNLVENGAEIVFTSIDEQGAPAVVYGQLGVPSTDLALNDPMYDGCVVMALIATQGELINYVLDLVGNDLFNFTGDGGAFMAQQFGEGGFDVNSIFDMLGTDFSLLINVFWDLTDAEAQTNMAAIRSHLHTSFAFDFAELLNLRIDQEFIEGLVGQPVDLPFNAINLFIYQVTNPFADAVDSVLDVMDETGFIQSIDRTVFTEARASGAGLLAVPDMGDLMDLIGGIGGDTNVTPSSFLLSQMPVLDGPMAIAAAGYIGDQVLSTSDDELNIFEDLLGKSPTSYVNALENGQSLVAAHLPPNMNLTSYSPEDESLGWTSYDENASIVFWNATQYADQPDYTLSFEAGDFPPLVTITRSFDPETTTPGGFTEVTVTVENDGTEPIYNVSLFDDSIATTYPNSVTVTGDTSDSTTTLAGGATLSITYTVTFDYEGVYAFSPAVLVYDYGNNTFSKHTHIDGFTVSADPIGLLQDILTQNIFGYPIPAIMVGVVGLGAIVNIALMARGKGGGGTYQV